MKHVQKSDSTLSQQDLEIQEMLAKADESRFESLLIDEEGQVITVDEMKQILIPSDTDDPVLKYDYYYHGIQKLLKKGLPEGDRYKNSRELIREEINTFLARGKRKKLGRRGADSRMGFIPEMEVALENIIQWTAKNESFVELYAIFKKLNEDYGK